MQETNKRDKAGWSLFNQSLTIEIYESADDRDERFFLCGDFSTVDSISLMKKARFLDRLHRREVPFIMVSESAIKEESALMCRGAYLPPVSAWQEILETSESQHMLLNGTANELLPFNTFSEALDPSSIMQLHDNFNLYLYISLIDENP